MLRHVAILVVVSSVVHLSPDFFFFFFNDTATTEIYTLSLHDALPICHIPGPTIVRCEWGAVSEMGGFQGDRKSTRLNSSHLGISYAVFCLKKKKNLYCVLTRLWQKRRPTCSGSKIG